MCWRSTSPMRERGGFIAAVERNDLTFAEICERFEIGRKLGYKWRALSPMSPTEHRRERAMPKITLEAFV